MDRSLKWRTLIFLISVVLCVGILLPTVMTGGQLPSWWPFDKAIQLGLDLQGGSHIVYSIDLDKAVDDRASELKRDFDSKFADEQIKATVKTPPSPTGAVTIVLADQANREKVLASIKADYMRSKEPEVEQIDCPATEAAGAICLKVHHDFAENLKKSALANAVNTIRERIDENGVAEPTVVQKGDEIIVELPGLDAERTAQTRDDIARAAKLEFKVVAEGNPFMAELFRHVGNEGGKERKATEPRAREEEIQAEIEQWRPDDGGDLRTDYYLLARNKPMNLTPDRALEIECVRRTEVTSRTVDGKINCPKVEGRHIIRWYLQDLAKADPKFVVPDQFQVAYEEIDPALDATDKRTMWRTYLLERAVRLTGTSISSATGQYDPNTNRPVVLIDFNRYGSRVFGDLTAEIVGRKLATILDDKVKSAPIINGAIRGGRASITMGGTDAQVQERERDSLVNVLKTGSLPAPLREESASKVGPTLGRDAIQKTQLSFILGVILVVLIMVGFYRKSGWIAVFAVLFHVLVTLAVMALFKATLTLPGIAALVLSVGMCVDGNILINERIRDELLLGKSVRGAVDLGFSRAFSAILDGQFTIAASAWVLLQYGSGPIKGFAVMMLVGVFTTVATNTWVTRIFFDWAVTRKKNATTLSI